MTVKVKICGITNLDDALAAADAGADYLGFILWPQSKRAAAGEQVRAMAAALRQRPNPPMLVGVFVDESAAEMARLLDDYGLDLAQLSGDEPASLVGDPESPIYGRSYKALRPLTFPEAEAEAEWYLPPEPAPGQPSLLLDTYHPILRGGTGQPADWTLAAQVRAVVPQLMLAGGLTPENVVQAIEAVRPFAVDVASGVERAPGRKDHERLRAFIKRAKRSDVDD